MWLYFNFLFLSNSFTSLPEMNLSPLTSSPSASLSSSSPPRANALSSAMTVFSSKGRIGMRHSSSVYIYILQLFIRLAPMLQNFTEYAPHLDGCSILLASNLFHFYSVGSDDVLFSYDANTQMHNTVSLHNPLSQQITAFAIHPKNTNSFVFGTYKGFVKYLRPIHYHQLQKAQIIYKGDKPIKSLSFDSSGKLVGIATQDQQTFIYSLKDKRLFSLSQRHQGGSIRIVFGGKGFVFSLGLQGILHLYEVKHLGEVEQDSQSQDPFASPSQSFSFTFIDKYRIASESITKKYGFFNAVFAEFNDGFSERVILASGQTYLQQIDLRQKGSTYKIQTQIREKQQILLVQVLTTGINQSTRTIVASTASCLSIWNYTKKERLLSINTTQELKGYVNAIVRVLTQQSPSFVFKTNNQNSTKLFYFKNQSLLNHQIQKPAEQVIIKKAVKQQKYESRWQPSKSAKLFPEYFQHRLQKHYEQYKGARFLFYNNIGCVIERIQGNLSTLELQLHDRSRPKRLHLDEKNRPFSMFALKQDIFVYATSVLLVFQSQKQLKQGFSCWQFRWQNIQGIAIGGDWIGVCSQDQIKVLDYSGNELHTICFDRSFITMQAYEDMLAVVYHSSPPMWGCQSLKVRIYQISPEKVKLQRDVMLPMTPNSGLKWFGFSEEGMIYCQDNLQVLRGYVYQRAEWQVVHSLQNSSDRMFIQHISGIDIYGFKLEQKQGEKIQPRVLPRSLPRKIPMELPSLQISFLNKQQETYLKKVKLRNMQILHQQFRYSRWYKLKYSRRKNHLWSEYSKSILSFEQIKTFKAQIDYQLVEYLKKYIKGIQDKSSQEYQLAARSLMLTIQRQSHFEQTKQAAKRILQIGKYQRSHLFEDAVVRRSGRGQVCLTKLNQINILQRMLNVLQKV